MKIENLKISQLVFDPNNARLHDQKNLEAIQASLEKFGQRKPIVVDKDGTIVAGNGTVEAALLMGWTEVAAVYIPEDWTADQIKAYAIADNRTAELAEWDQAVLEKQLEELEKNGFEVSSLGFEVPELPLADLEVKEDEVPELPDDPKSKLGQMWQLGDHVLRIGDGTNMLEVNLAMGSDTADMVLTDPPYNVNYTGGTDEQMTIQNDDMGDIQFKQFLKDSFEASLEVTKEGGPIYVFYADGSANSFRAAFTESGWSLRQTLIWVKDSLVLSRQDYNWIHEPILYGWKPGAAHMWYGDFTNTTVMDSKLNLEDMGKEQLQELVQKLIDTSTVVREKRPRKSSLHPTMKPLELLSKLMKNSMKSGDLVFDPFAGSGSTLMAAEQLGLRSVSMEIDPRYADVIIERWENWTDKKAVLLNGDNG